MLYKMHKIVNYKKQKTLLLTLESNIMDNEFEIADLKNVDFRNRLSEIANQNLANHKSEIVSR